MINPSSCKMQITRLNCIAHKAVVIPVSEEKATQTEKKKLKKTSKKKPVAKPTKRAIRPSKDNQTPLAARKSARITKK